MDYEVVVCGTGVVGLSMAVALAKQQKKVCLIGHQYKPLAPQDDHYHPRIYAISPASVKLLQELGVFTSIDPTRCQTVHAMEIHGDGKGVLTLDRSDGSCAELATIMESGQIEQALQQALRFLNVPWINSKVEHYEPGLVVTQSGESITTELCIAADGESSMLRDMAGIAHTYHPYDDFGLVAQLNCEKPHDHVAYQWFFNDGILALLPLPDTSQGHQVSMVWSIRERLAMAWLNREPEEMQHDLSEALQAITNGRLGQLSIRSQLRGFPLTLQETDLSGNGMILIGDAAHRLHPLTGHGLNVGLSDVAACSRILANKEHFRRCDDPHILSRYRQERQLGITKVKVVTDGLYRLFASHDAGVSVLRNEGLSLVDKSPLIKRQLIAAAIGE